MKIKYFDYTYDDGSKEFQRFVESHNIIDIKNSVRQEYGPGAPDLCKALVMYDDLSFKVKYFREDDYVEEAEFAYRTSYTLMEDAVNKFCANHNVVKIETTQNSDEDLVTVVTYKE